MMKSMITENGITFKDLEKNIYVWACQIGQQFTKEFLKRYDQILMKERDKDRYHHKRNCQTTVKTVHGEVTYSRVVYKVTEEDGVRHYVYLLDESLQLSNMGLISTNMSELLVKGTTEPPYWECAAKVSEMTGQTISTMGGYGMSCRRLEKRYVKEKGSC